VTDRSHLEAELSAARQELARERIDEVTPIPEYTERLAYLPDRPITFSRLAALDAETLEHTLPDPSVTWTPWRTTSSDSAS
jgi:hypothetical protein